MQGVLVFGLPRSGTTLVANILNSQPGCTVYADFLEAPIHAALRAGGFRRVLSPRSRNQLVFRVKLQVPQLGDVPQHATPADIHTSALHCIAEDGDRIVGHKVTGNVDILPQLLEETELRVVYLVRDIRDLVLSHWEIGNENAERIVEAWRCVWRTLPYLRSHPRLAVIRYEELILDPRRTLTPVERLLNIDLRFDSSSLKANRSNTEWRGNSSFHDVTKLFDHAPVGRWYSHQDAPAVRYAVWRCKRELQRHCYRGDLEQPLSLTEKLGYAQRVLVRQADLALTRARAAAMARLLPPLRGSGHD